MATTTKAHDEAIIETQKEREAHLEKRYEEMKQNLEYRLKNTQKELDRVQNERDEYKNRYTLLNGDPTCQMRVEWAESTREAMAAAVAKLGYRVIDDTAMKEAPKMAQPPIGFPGKGGGTQTFNNIL